MLKKKSNRLENTMLLSFINLNMLNILYIKKYEFYFENKSFFT